MNSIFYCPGEERIFVTVFAAMDGIVCFAIEMTSATQNWVGDDQWVRLNDR